MNHVDSNLVPCGERTPPHLAPPAPSALPDPRSAPPAPPASEQSDPEHRTFITEAGSFTTARCECGWFAPARRSREKSRRDADTHHAADPAA